MYGGITIIYIAISLFFCTVLFDYKNIISFKNYFLFYIFILFVVGSSFFYKGETLNNLRIDFIIYSFSFIIGYYFYFILPKRKIKRKILIPEESLKLKLKLEKIILCFIITVYFFKIFTILKVGFINFYSGKLLVESISMYGKENVAATLMKIISVIIDTSLTALMIYYIAICIHLKFKIKTSYLVLIYVLFPLISLSRSGFIFGLLFVLFVNFLIKGNVSFAKIIIFIILIIFIGTFFGVIRENRIKDVQTNYFDNFGRKIVGMVSGELSPIIAYNEIKENIELLDYKYGKTILLPLIFKPIPRSIWPKKPYNSSGYYMFKLHPDYANKGFFIAPSIFGDIFLNFGYLGCIIFTFTFGILISYFDSKLIKLIGDNITYMKIGFLLVLFLSFYGLLRNNLPESLFSIFSVYIVFYLIDRVKYFKW